MGKRSCDSCKNASTSPTVYPCCVCDSDANKYEPQTNADRIRTMSDEELAEFLLKVNCSYSEPCMTGETDCKWEDYPTHDKGCKDCFLEWLQAEVKEGNSNENT